MGQSLGPFSCPLGQRRAVLRSYPQQLIHDRTGNSLSADAFKLLWGHTGLGFLTGEIRVCGHMEGRERCEDRGRNGSHGALSACSRLGQFFRTHCHLLALLHAALLSLQWHQALKIAVVIGFSCRCKWTAHWGRLCPWQTEFSSEI